MPAPLVAGAAIAVGKGILNNVVRKTVANAVSAAVNEQIKSLPREVRAAVPPTTGPVVEKVLTKLEADPEFINQTNSEQWYQSGVAWGAVVSALGVIVPQVASVFGYDVSSDYVMKTGSALVTIGGALYVLYRRFAPNLKPLFSKKS